MKPILEAKALGIKYRRYVKRTTTLKEVMIRRFQGTHYEAYWALRHVNLAIQRGEVLGVIGPNGAGKSTLLKALSGILPPSEGSIDARGKIAPLLSIGGAFRADLTGRENVMLHGAIWGISKRQMNARLDSIVEFADLSDFIDSPIYTYSSGMRARLGFAVATDIDPEILLLDEILSVGDAAFRTKALTRMEQFFKQGKTIIMVSHSLNHIQHHCTRAVYLRAGHLIADGKPSKIIEQYMHDVQNQT